MKLSFVLNKAGFTPENIDTKCVVTFDTQKGSITLSELTVTATVPEITKEQFDEAVNDAKTNCPISKSLNAEITCEAKLV
jgi:lipoyl-dependent peroxiredoxin